MLDVFNSLIRSEYRTCDENIVSFINPYSYLILRKSKGLDVDLWGVDGQFAVLLFRLFGVWVKRLSFDMTSLAPKVFEHCSNKGLPVAIVGAKESEVSTAVSVFKKDYPNINICYYRDGYFTNEQERKQCFDKIKESGAKVVIVGMGTPIQEQFLVDLRESGWQGTGYTCGGFLHQTASKGAQYYPNWINRLHLRWLYRMWDEPKLIKRYMLYYPQFLALAPFDLIKYRLKRK